MSDSNPQGTVTPGARAARPVDGRVDIGHVHLRTADIDRVRAFYVDVLGFDVVFERRDVPAWGTTGDMLFLSAGGYHHHLAFNTWLSAGADPMPHGVTGLHHVALRYPTKESLGDAARRLRDADWEVRLVEDYGTHLAVYCSDPDQNGVELMWDRPMDEWPLTEDGAPRMSGNPDLTFEEVCAF